METKSRNTWMPVAIVAIVIALLLLCVLAACGCIGLALIARSDRGVGEFTQQVPAPIMTVVPELIGGGAIITYVQPNSPADMAGLQRGDIIVAVDSIPIDANHDLAQVIGAYQPGTTVTIRYRQWSTGQTATTNVTLGANPSDSSQPYLGIDYSAAPSLGGNPGQ